MAEKIIYTHAPLPATLLVNGESRQETLRHYKLAFQLAGYESRVYFGLGDMACVAWQDLDSFRGCADLGSIKE